MALGITNKCKAPFEPRCIGWLHDGGPSSVVVVADDALDSRLLYDVNGLRPEHEQRTRETADGHHPRNKVHLTVRIAGIDGGGSGGSGCVCVFVFWVEWGGWVEENNRVDIVIEDG